MRWFVVVLVAACGAQRAPAPVVVTKQPSLASRPPAPITCADVAVILRGRVADERAAGPMKEEAIAKACLHDKWSQDVIDCAGSTPSAKRCLARLDAKQRSALAMRLGDWNEEFPDETFDDPRLDEDFVDFVDCTKAIGDASRYAPVLTQTGEARELAVAMRRHQLLALCEGWLTEHRLCFEREQDDPDGCRMVLPPAWRQAIVDRLAEVDAVMAKVAATKPPTCQRVVAFHYADARWKDKLAAMKAAARKKIIAESRARMRKACTDESWTASLRSCIVAQGGDHCFHAASITPATWGFPASGIPVKTGIPECDAYGDALRALASCKQIPRQAVQTMLDQYQEAVPTFAIMSAAQRTAAARSCTHADAAIRQSARSLGCTI